MMPIVSSVDAATLASKDLVEALKHHTQIPPFDTINGTHNTKLRNLAELFNAIHEVPDKQSTNRHI